jgi:hypothetical protein
VWEIDLISGASRASTGAIKNSLALGYRKVIRPDWLLGSCTTNWSLPEPPTMSWDAGVISGVWHSNADSCVDPKKVTVVGISQSWPSATIPFPKGVQVPDGAVYGVPEHDRVPPP